MRGLAWVGTTAAMLAFTAAPAVASFGADRPSPGAADIGDPLFPGLGNGGYDVAALHARSRLRHDRLGADDPAVVETIQARATQALSRFDLDFSGDSVASVTVDGRRAAFAARGRGARHHSGPSDRDHRALRRSASATPPARGRSAPRTPADLNKVVATAWFATPSGSITAAQPNGAHRIFPNNDVPVRPGDATRSARSRPPARPSWPTASCTGKRTPGGRTLWSYEEREPMASRADPAGLRRAHRRERGPGRRRAAARRRAHQPDRRARAGAGRARATTWTA